LVDKATGPVMVVEVPEDPLPVDDVLDELLEPPPPPPQPASAAAIKRGMKGLARTARLEQAGRLRMNKTG
jgi:hypothetical protein